MLRRFTSKPLRNLSGNVPRKLFSSQYEWPSAFSGIEKASTPPTSWYKEKDFLDKVEKEHTFRRWLNVGTVQSLKNEGDYLACTVLDQPIVIVKSKNGINAFYNVCRHHAAQICDEGTGSIGPNGRFTCPYHGWQYNSEGRLTKAVKMKGCENFSPKEFGLHSLPVQIVGPWIYVNFAPSKGTDIYQDINDLSTMEGLLKDSKYEQLIHYKSRNYVLPCNWKVFIDNYLDGGYHVPVAHKDLSANLDIDKYERRSYTNFHLQSCPTPASTPSGLPDDRIDGGAPGSCALYIFQYPNICINRYGKWMDTNITWPLGPDKCLVTFD
jgi:choline monooxygenase